eukprot:GHVP01067088.1.p1 GENE.GHVP01067088.1~~GHVP01067088.1.p1  ORF type:complete len:1004 (+),score=222.34 GHVP01067088.1:233-3013(+)
MEDYSESVSYALKSGSSFDFKEKSLFTKSVMANIVARYINTRRGTVNFEDDPETSAELERTFARMFEHSIREDIFDALGIAIEAKRFDLVKKCVEPKNDLTVIKILLKDLLPSIKEDSFKSEIKAFCVESLSRLMFTATETSHLVLIGTLLVSHGIESSDPVPVLRKLIDSSENEPRNFLEAINLAIEFYQTDTRKCRLNFVNHPSLQSKQIKATANIEKNPSESDTLLQKDDVQISAATENKLLHIKSILSGDTPAVYELFFMHQKNHTDLASFEKLKNSPDTKNSSILLNALIVCHSFLQCGTTCDTFLRENLDWLSRAVCWVKFTSVSSLAVVHKGSFGAAFKVLDSYLPDKTTHFAGGGCAFGLGIITEGSCDKKVKEYLLEQLRPSCPEMVKHGAALGLASSFLGSQDPEIVEACRAVLYMDSAVPGEAAAMAIGLLTCGAGNKKSLDELISYAKDSQHDKIKRGCGLGIAMGLFKQENAAIGTIDELLCSNHMHLRYSAVLTIGMAFCATANNDAIRRLLKVVASDPAVDVQRSAVLSLGFVIAGHAEMAPQLLGLLVASYNPHIRYGAALALGIACMSTGDRETLNMLHALALDAVDYVRQGAFLAYSLVAVGIQNVNQDLLTKIDELVVKVARDKQEGLMVRSGAIMSYGIRRAGGRNVKASIFSRSGDLYQNSVCGLLLFSQYWHWYPLVNFLSFCFVPQIVIPITWKEEHTAIPCGLSMEPTTSKLEDLSYPQSTAISKKDEAKPSVKAVLSATLRRQSSKAVSSQTSQTSALASAVLKEKEEKEKEVETQTSKSPPKAAKRTDVGENNEEKVEEKKTIDDLTLPRRILSEMSDKVKIAENQKWKPLDASRRYGFLVVEENSEEISAEDYYKIALQHLKPKVSEPSPPAGPTTPPSVAANEETEELKAPEPFEWQG